MELPLCVGARTSRIGDHHWSRRSYACTACPALLEPRTLMLVMTNHVAQARAFRAFRHRVVMRALRVRCCPRLPMTQRYDHHCTCTMLLTAPRASATCTRFHEHAPWRSFFCSHTIHRWYSMSGRSLGSRCFCPTYVRPPARFALCTLVWHAGRRADFDVPCARRRRLVPSRIRQRQRDERSLRSAELRSPR